MITVAFDTIESKIDRRWVPAAQSFEQARKDILTVIRHLAGERPTIKRAMREYWLESDARATAFGVALEMFHVLNDLGYVRANRLYKALKLHADVNKALGPKELFRFASPEKAAVLIQSSSRADYASSYANLKFGCDLSGTIDADTARDVLNRHEALWFVYPNATYHVHLIREGVWLDIDLPLEVVDELRLDVDFAMEIRQAELDAQGALS